MTSSPGAAFEALERRFQCAAGISLAGAADAPPTVVLNTRGTLFIGGTEDEDSIRLRVVGDTLQITLTSLNDTSASPFAPEALPGESPIKPQSVTLSTIDDASIVTRVYTVALDRIGRIFLDGRAGHDVASVKSIPIDVTPNDTERFDVVPLPAPEGQKPWQAVARTDARWIDASRKQLALANASRATSAFFGDSHSERFPLVGADSWKTHFAKSLNLGIAGDSTQQLLWRIGHGLFDKFKPSLLIVTVGTNNLNTTAHCGTADEIARGIQAVVHALRAKLPETRIVLLGIIPRRRAWQNERIVQINAQSRDLTADRRVQFLDLYPELVGAPVRERMYIPLDEHLSALGYALLTERLTKLLRATL